MKNGIAFASVYLLVTTFLHGCGGGGGGSDSSPAPSAPPKQDTFSEMSIPTGFDWKTQQQHSFLLSLESAISFQDQTASTISGKHIVEFYQVSAEGVKDESFLKGMTNTSGEWHLVFSLPTDVSAVEVVVSLPSGECRNQYDVIDLDYHLKVSCAVSLSSDN